MKTIWKFSFRIEDYFELQLPKDAEILSLHKQKGISCIWVLLNPKEKTVTRKFRIFGTGQPIDSNLNLKFIGTFLIANDELVFHLFELL